MCRQATAAAAAAAATVVVVVITMVLTCATAAAAAAVPSGAPSQPLTCQRCTCGQQDSVFSMHCQLTGTEDVVLNSSGPLDFSSRTLYMRVENASSLHMGEAFLAALRRYYSVAIDLWTIRNVTFDTEFRPQNRFLFMGVGIVNCTVPELPRGVLSHSNAVGLRVTGSNIGVLRRGAFAQVSKVRYIELSSSHVQRFEGPQMGRLQLSHRRHVHHGSSGLQVHDTVIELIEEGALSVDTQMDDEFVEITDSTISELGPGGLSVSGIGSVTINGTEFGYLATGALDLSSHGGITLVHSRVRAAAPGALWRVRGGADTRLENISFDQPPSPSVLLLDKPTGEEQVEDLRFRCDGEMQAGWTAAATAGRSTVSEGLRRFLKLAEENAECDPTLALTPGQAGKHQTAPNAAGSRTSTTTSSSTPPLFSNAGQVGLELLILSAVVAAVVLGVVAYRRTRGWWGPVHMSDAQVLVEASETHAE